MTWTQVLDQLIAWLQDPPTCYDGGTLGVIPIHCAIEYARNAMAEGIPQPEAMHPADLGIDIYWPHAVRHWRVNHDGTVTAWEMNEWRESR